jgi:hypothetical protein
MKEYNAFQENNIAIPPVSNRKIWRWDSDYFTNPFNSQREIIPSYFDAPYPSSEFVLNGPLSTNGLTILDANYSTVNKNLDVSSFLYLNPGIYSYLTTQKHLFSSEHIRKIWGDTASLAIVDRINFKHAVEIATYERKSENSLITIKKKYIYSPDSNLLDPTKHEWKISGNLLVMGAAPGTPVTAIIYPFATNDISQFYFLPEFPAANIIISGLQVSDYTIDNLLGIIKIPKSLNLSSINISYTSLPMVTYVPQSGILDYAKLDFTPIDDNNYFVTISAATN